MEHGREDREHLRFRVSPDVFDKLVQQVEVPIREN